VLVACWSAKGGSGTTTVAAELALVLAPRSPAGVLLADLGGDLPAVLGLPDPVGPGVADWLAARGDDAALDRLAVEATPSLCVLPLGSPSAAAGLDAGDGERLTAALAAHPAAVLDCGPPRAAPGVAAAAMATVSLLVMRPCFLALRRALEAPIRPSRVVLVDEPGHLLRPRHISGELGVPIGARVPWDIGVPRRVDGGLLARGLPRPLARALRGAA